MYRLYARVGYNSLSSICNPKQAKSLLSILHLFQVPSVPPFFAPLARPLSVNVSIPCSSKEATKPPPLLVVSSLWGSYASLLHGSSSVLFLCELSYLVSSYFKKSEVIVNI